MEQENHDGIGPVERVAGRVQAPKTEGRQLQLGDEFTIEGYGTSARGHQVRHGRSVTTGRRMKVKKLQVFVVMEASA